ncbi:hypothetical protein Btru_068330 [Bulinus truncatus]|nr:hypothetical protein Btru_068330 [Bulinus truncatus]
MEFSLQATELEGNRKLALPPLAVDTHEECVENIIDFIAKAATHLESQKDNTKNKNAASENEFNNGEPTHPFLVKLFEFLISIHRYQDYTIRFRVCQLIYKLLSHLKEYAQIECELFDSILNSMLERLHDNCPLVRAFAVFALSRLQTPQDNTCPVLKESLEDDADVRAVVESDVEAVDETVVETGIGEGGEVTVEIFAVHFLAALASFFCSLCFLVSAIVILLWYKRLKHV